MTNEDCRILDDREPRRLTDAELGGRAALEAAGLEPVDGWDDDADDLNKDVDPSPAGAPPRPRLTARVRRGLGQLLRYWGEDHMYEALDPKHPGVRRLGARDRRDAHAAIRWALDQVNTQTDRDAARAARRQRTPAGVESSDELDKHKAGDVAGDTEAQAQPREAVEAEGGVPAPRSVDEPREHNFRNVFPTRVQ